MAAVLSVSLLPWWIGTGLLARNVRPWAIEVTNLCVAIGFVACYVAPWAMAIYCVAESTQRRMVFRAIATTMLVAFLLLILESAAIAGLVDYSEVWNRLSGEWDGPSTNYVTDWDIGFRHPAYAKWSGLPRSDMAVYWNLPIRREAPMSFSTDKRGFRNREDRDDADIVLLGDSYVEGAYVSDDETAAAVLEKRTGLRVTNLGMAGFGTLQELETLSHLGVGMKPRMVAWFFFEGNDLYDDEGFEGSLPFLREHRPYTSGRWNWSWNDFCARSLTRTLFRAARRQLDTLIPNSVATCGTYRDARGTVHQMYYYSYGTLHFEEYEANRFDKTKSAFCRGRDICRENNIELVVFFIPMKFRVYGDLCEFPPSSPCVNWEPWKLADYFAEFCGQQSISLVDLTPPMRAAAAAGELLYAPEDSHWNTAGQAFSAGQIEEQWNRYSAREP